MGTWDNADGLRILTGVTEAVPTKLGEYKTFGALRVWEGILTLSAAPSAGGATGIVDGIDAIPAGARIEEVIAEVQTGASTGSSPTLDVGLIKTDRSTELDYNGLIAAAAASTIDTAGKRLTIVAAGTAAGALIGTTLAFSGYLCFNYNTAAFTTGVIRVRVGYWFP